MDTNYAGVVSLFNIVANDFEQKRNGFIIGISSVQGIVDARVIIFMVRRRLPLLLISPV